MAYAQEIRLDALPDDADPRIDALLETWKSACLHNNVPWRRDLGIDILAPWIDDISIYEYLPRSHDFKIRVDARNIIEASGESYLGGSPREIDLNYGTNVFGNLCEVMASGTPRFHMIGVDREGWEFWLRLMLPVKTSSHDIAEIDQIFVCHFPYRQG